MSKQRVLIVDDEPDIRELLEITLLRMGLETRSAADYSEATRILHEETFDLCLTDMKLPDGDGIALVEHIQQHCPNTPSAVITAPKSNSSAVTDDCSTWNARQQRYPMKTAIFPLS